MKHQSEDMKWSRAIKERARGRCEIGLAGCSFKAVHAMHIVPRGFIKLRHDLDNGLAGCCFCHQECDSLKADLIGLLQRIDPDRYSRLKVKFREMHSKDLDLIRGNQHG